MSETNRKGQSGVTITVIFVVIVIIGFLLMVLGFDTVPANNLGVMVAWGDVRGIMHPGTQWTGFSTTVENYDLRMRQMTVQMQGDGAAVDKDGQSVFATIDINYRLNPDNVLDAYRKIGVDADLAKILNIDGIIKEGFKTVTSKYTSTEIWQDRERIKKEAIDKISEHFPSNYFILENVVVSNLDYNKAFKDAIEAQKTNEKLALAKEAEVNIAKYEADKTIENARGASESKKLAADAEAYTTLTKAKAEAEALRMKKSELTPLMVQNNMIDKWDGHYPTTLMMTPSSNFLMQLPSQTTG